MKVELINKEGLSWEFSSVKAAVPHIKKEMRNCFTEIVKDGKKVRVYDDREEI